ncbi:AraC family transcriptional regulator [Paenibacillus thailandensis]|uniref:AraC family transcriptional regulator n=1 Tax=Paenibacillus thailandensis TaxID=393250 RepID=A0ABW5QY29_9BACL
MRIKYWAGRHPKGHYFLRSLILILFIACVPGLVTGGALYGWVTVRMERVLQQSHSKQIEQRAEAADKELDDLELAFSQWAFNPTFDGRLKELDFVFKYKQVHELYRTLLIVRDSNSLIGDVQLYLRQPKPLTMDATRYDYLSDPVSAARYEGLLDPMQTIYWTRASDNGSPMLVTQLTDGGDRPFGALTMRLDPQRLNMLLQTLTPSGGGHTLLLDETGEWISPPAEEQQGLYDALRQEAAGRDGASLPFRFEYKGETYSVMTGQFRRLGNDWTYVSAVPLTQITAPLLSMSRVIVGINAAGLVLALLLSWFASLRLYRPLGRLLTMLAGERGARDLRLGDDELERIERSWTGMSRARDELLKELERQQPLVRSSLLLQLAQGHLVSSSETELRERLAQSGWRKRDSGFIILYARVRPKPLPAGTYAKGEGEMTAFAAAELLKRQAGMLPYPSELLNFHDMSMALLLNVPWDAEAECSARSLLLEAGQAWCEAASAKYGIRITAAVSGWAREAMSVPQLLRETRYAIRQGWPLLHRQVLDANEPALAPGNPLRYPFEIEQELIASMRGGNEQAAMDSLKRFMLECSGEEASGIRLRDALPQLLGGIRQTLIQLEREPSRLFGYGVFDELLALQSAEEVTEWFGERIIKPCIKELAGSDEDRLQSVLHLMKEHADRHYAAAMSLEEFAYEHGVHSYTLSRAFKQHFGQNYVDYLTDVRLGEAKRLLEHTDCKMTVIAERVGYQPSYFNRIFKKHTGITPSRYREIVHHRGLEELGLGTK